MEADTEGEIKLSRRVRVEHPGLGSSAEHPHIIPKVKDSHHISKIKNALPIYALLKVKIMTIFQRGKQILPTHTSQCA